MKGWEADLRVGSERAGRKNEIEGNRNVYCSRNVEDE